MHCVSEIRCRGALSSVTVGEDGSLDGVQIQEVPDHATCQGETKLFRVNGARPLLGWTLLRYTRACHVFQRKGVCSLSAARLLMHTTVGEMV
jgi:hypothetical protein